MTCEDARKSFAEYWRGGLDAACLNEFESHLAQCERCRMEAESLRQVWGALGDIPEPEPGPAMRARFYASLAEWERREPRWRHGFGARQRWLSGLPQGALAAIAAALILAAGIAIGQRINHGPAQVAQLENEVNSMKQLVTLSLLEQQNASDRLRGVSWAYRVEQPDGEVLAALLTTVNHDPSVNVRLAAVDALRKFAASPVGRKGLVQSLSKQTSPLVQIAILDEIAGLHDKSATGAVRDLIDAAGADPSVKEHAKWALNQLR